MSRRDRAREVLADDVGLQWVADEIRAGENPIYEISPETCVDMMLAFADAELERAAHRCLEMADMIGAMPGSSIASALTATCDSIRAMMEEE